MDMDLKRIRQQLKSLPNQVMAEDIDEVLAWMDERFDPHMWLSEYAQVHARLSYWVGELQTNVRHHEIELGRIKGELDQEIRDQILHDPDDGKVTEDKVRRRIYANTAYRSRAQILAACKGILTFLRGLRTAWNPDMLVQLSVNWRRQAEAQ